MDTVERFEGWRLNTDSIVRNAHRAVVAENYKGEVVTQYLNVKRGRWYVTISKKVSLHLIFGRVRMLRSHFVWMLENNFSKIPKGRVIHHIDHNRQNDDPVNLVLMSYEQHDAYHSTEEAKKVSRKTRSTQQRRHTPETIARIKEVAQERGNNDIWGGEKKRHFLETKVKMSAKASGSMNSQFRSDLNEDAVISAFRELGSLAEVARVFNCSISAVRERVDGYAKSQHWLEVSDEELYAKFKELNFNMTRTARALGAPTTSFSRKINRIKNELH